MKKVITRFAPSPTGYLHLGGARTALFNYLLAKNYQGKFLIRFEDTDQKRNISDAKEKILAELAWLGIKNDNSNNQPDLKGFYSQSARLTTYQKMGEKLQKEKKVYYCFCTKERLAKVKKEQLKKAFKAPRYDRHCWQLTSKEIANNLKKALPKCYRIKVPDNQQLCFIDLVYGEMKFNTDHIEDFVIIKSDGYPTYHFAVTVDDLLMKITHVLRGSDHLSNTAKQILLYQILIKKPPIFAHLSLIQIKKEKKISKRSGDLNQYISYYQEEGYLASALFNYLALLGWTPDKFQELYQPKELIAKFDGQNLNKSQSIFSLVKLNWINHKHISWLTKEKYWQYSQKYCQMIQKKHNIREKELQIMVAIFQTEINYFAQLPSLIEKNFFHPFLPEEKLMIFLKENKEVINCLEKTIPTYSWEEKAISQMVMKIGEKLTLKGEKLLKPIRIIASGRTSGPPIVKTLLILGKEKILANISHYQKWEKKKKKF